MKTAEALARNYQWPRVRIPAFNGYFSLYEHRLLVTRGDCSATRTCWELRGMNYMRWQERSYPDFSLCVYSAHFCSALRLTSFIPNNKWQEGFTFCFCNKGLLRVKSMEQFVFPCIILDFSTKAFHFVRPDQLRGTYIMNRVPSYCKSDIYIIYNININIYIYIYIYIYTYTHTHTHTHTHTEVFVRKQATYAYISGSLKSY